MPGSSLENTLNRAVQIREGIKNLKIKYDNTYLGPITASFGVACFPTYAENSNNLLMIADQALYEATKQSSDLVVAAS